MRGPIEEYRPLLARSFAQARERVFGNPEQLAAGDAQREALAVYAERPVGFIREYLGERSWAAGRHILRAVIKHRRVHVCGCRKSSKSHTAAQSVLAMTCTAPTRTIVTGATYTQVRENIFARVRKLHANARKPLPGRCGVTSMRMPSDPNWFAIGISTNKPGYLQGFHADITLPPAYEYDDEMIDEDSLLAPDPKLAEEDARRSERDAGEVIDEEVWRAKKDKARLFFVLDEMAEMRPDIVETLAGSWMGDNVFVLSQFNPTFEPDSGHPARRFLNEDSGWHRIHIAGREPPAEQHDDTLFDKCFHQVPPEMMPDSWVEERKQDWQPDSAMFICHVLGLPAGAMRERQFIPARIIKAQLTRVLKDDGRVASRHIGYDVAGSDSGDWSVAQLWICGMLTEEEEWRWADTAASRERVMMLTRKWGIGSTPIPWRNVHIDATGGSMGKSIADEMRARGCRVDAVDFGGGPENDWERLVGSEMHFVNRKAELLWVMRCALDKGIAAIPGTKGQQGGYRFGHTLRQAQWYTFKEVARAQGTAIQCAETKEEIKELHKRSPDNLEAGMLAWSRGGQALTISKPMTPGQIGRRLAR
jgi:hypothetical protein